MPFLTLEQSIVCSALIGLLAHFAVPLADDMVTLLRVLVLIKWAMLGFIIVHILFGLLLLGMMR